MESRITPQEQIKIDEGRLVLFGTAFSIDHDTSIHVVEEPVKDEEQGVLFEEEA